VACLLSRFRNAVSGDILRLRAEEVPEHVGRDPIRVFVEYLIDPAEGQYSALPAYKQVWTV
jgi:hypothetical protein